MVNIFKIIPQVILRHGHIYTIAFLCVIAAEAGIIVFAPSHSSIEESAAVRSVLLDKYADEVLEQCAKSKSRPACYDAEIPKLMDKISLEDAFRVTAAIQQKDGEYWYCHVLGHALSAREVKKDPSKWKEVVTRCPSGMCSNGCIHGGFQERFRTDVLSDADIDEFLPDFKEVCDKRPSWNPTRLEQATCYHALGHLAMYITDANIHKATEICGEVAITKDGWNFSQICFDGAFMQIFQPLEPEDFALIEGKQPSKEELKNFCSQFSGEKRGSCWNEGWPLFFEEVKNPDGLVKFCSVLQDVPSQEQRCYDALFYVLTAQFKLDSDRMKNFCGGLPQEKMAQCFLDAATRMIETDSHLVKRSMELCESAKNFGVERPCYDGLAGFASYNFHRGSQEFSDLCTSLPEPWSRKCFSRARN